MSLELQAKTAGIPLDVLRRPQRLVAEGKGSKNRPAGEAKPPEPGG